VAVIKSEDYIGREKRRKKEKKEGRKEGNV
jgi:hypothetical protein